MKKKLLILIIIIITFVIYISYNRTYKNNKFYLDDIYYEKNSFININADGVTNLKNSSYIIFTYNNFCKFEIPCEEIFVNSMSNNNIGFYKISYDEYKNTYLFKKVKYAPSVIIVKKGKIIAYLDANSKKDIIKYQDVNAFNNWLNNYIYLSK